MGDVGMSEFEHPLLAEVLVDPGAAVRTIGSVLEMAEVTGCDFAGAVFPTDRSRAGLVYGAVQSGGHFDSDLLDLRLLLTVGRSSLRRLAKGSRTAVTEVDEWRARAELAEAEVVRLRLALAHPGLAGGSS